MTLESYSAAKWKKEGNTKLPFNPICTKKSYSVELSMYDFYALIQYDNEQAYEEEGFKSLLDMLEKLGACDVDFHGMFGAYIFFSLETEDNTKECWQNIEDVLEQYIIFAHMWQDKENELERLTDETE